MSDAAQGENDEFLNVMRDTRARYVAGFADQLDQMRSLTADAGRGGQLETLRTMAHRLAGLSGTLGFDAVSTQASELESIVDDVLAGKTFDPGETMLAIERVSEAFAGDLSNPPSWAVPPGGQT